MATSPARYTDLYQEGYAEGRLAVEQRRVGIRRGELAGTALYEAENWFNAHMGFNRAFSTAKDMLLAYQEYAVGFIDAVLELRRG